MSDSIDKEKRSRRLHLDEIAIKKQFKIAKAYGLSKKILDQPHRLDKHHALDCGNPKCPVCSSPRKLTGERTIQEKKFYQKELQDEE